MDTSKNVGAPATEGTPGIVRKQATIGTPASVGTPASEGTQRTLKTPLTAKRPATIGTPGIVQYLRHLKKNFSFLTACHRQAFGLI